LEITVFTCYLSDTQCTQLGYNVHSRFSMLHTVCFIKKTALSGTVHLMISTLVTYHPGSR